jgi:hypothetical protein
VKLVRHRTEKVGSKVVLHLILEPEPPPVFPEACPCCLEKPDPGAYIEVRHRGYEPLRFPCCRVCARHTRVMDSVSTVVGYGTFWLTLLTVAGILMFRGANNAASAGATGGWTWLGALANLQFPFMGPINAGVTALGAIGVFLGYLVVLGGPTYVLGWYLSKGSCKWFHDAVRTEKADDPANWHLVFENLVYADRFVESNTPREPDETG